MVKIIKLSTKKSLAITGQVYYYISKLDINLSV